MGAEGKYDLYLENIPKPPDSEEEVPADIFNSILSDQVSYTRFTIILYNVYNLEINILYYWALLKIFLFMDMAIIITFDMFHK